MLARLLRRLTCSALRAAFRSLLVREGSPSLKVSHPFLSVLSSGNVTGTRGTLIKKTNGPCANDLPYPLESFAKFVVNVLLVRPGGRPKWDSGERITPPAGDACCRAEEQAAAGAAHQRLNFFQPAVNVLHVSPKAEGRRKLACGSPQCCHV